MKIKNIAIANSINNLFRFSMGSVEEKYREVYNLVCSEKNQG